MSAMKQLALLIAAVLLLVSDVRAGVARMRRSEIRGESDFILDR